MIASRANKVLGMLIRTFTSRDANLWKLLYVSLVRPLLEFAAPVWNPHSKSEIEIMERVQRRESRIPLVMRKLLYLERLKIKGLSTLEERRSRGDLIQMYKSLNGLEDINWYTGPRFAPATQTRSAGRNGSRLIKEPFPSSALNSFGHFVSVRHEFFLNRVVERWNELPNSIILKQSLNGFKASIDNFSKTAAIAH